MSPNGAASPAESRSRAREVVAAKRTDCPHYLGGGIGLVASAHLLAACNGGWLEVDSNTNPLRNDFCGAVTVIRDGEIVLPELPGAWHRARHRGNRDVPDAMTTGA